MEPEFWNERYAGDDYFYGTAPNGFVAECAPQIPPGPVLCLAEGEGRNAVFLASRGYAVTAVDQSAVGLAKAQRLAADRKVALTTVVTDLAEFIIEPGGWSGIVATFLHLPQPLRRNLHRQVAAGLRPGGVFIFEAYTPAQVTYRTGGPVNQPELLVNPTELPGELATLDVVVLRELIRDVTEGSGHRGVGAVVQMLARRP
jgi:SAM-dependent methyltransferase